MMMVEKPLTPEQIDRLMDRNGNIRVQLAIDLNVLIDNDRESLNDYVGDMLVEGVMKDISYDIAGYTFNGTDENGEELPKKVILEVTGQVVSEDTDWFWN
jgi:hypothetical protein